MKTFQQIRQRFFAQIIDAETQGPSAGGHGGVVQPARRAPKDAANGQPMQTGLAGELVQVPAALFDEPGDLGTQVGDGFAHGNSLCVDRGS